MSPSNTTPFDTVMSKVRDTYKSNVPYKFDIFVKQADGQIFHEHHYWPFRDVALHYFQYVMNYPNRSIAITNHDTGILVASASWNGSDVFFMNCLANA